jgi:flagellar hook assembly protein FlgD
VTLEIYNVLGQRVRTLVRKKQERGLHRVSWNGENRYGTRVGSGVYFCRIEAGRFTATQKMVLVR